MPESDLPPLIRALLRPQAYPHPTGKITLLQTHISYVLLAGDFVYKIKKPVDFGFLNYSTLGRRRYNCRREVELNSRLCADTYLGVLPIREHEGKFVLGGKRGRVLEYAVHMRRLPQDRMMDELLARGEVTPAMVELIAEKLVPFHASAETSPKIARYGDWAIRYNTQENVDQWTPYIGRTLTPEQDAILRAYFEAFWARRADVLARRVEQLRIRRTHADLRSDAVCFLGDDPPAAAGAALRTGICIFDCVEFSDRISLLDVARDTGFLAMDLDFRGHEDLAGAFVRRYIKLAKDPDHEAVLAFYECYSACVRGKVEGFLLDQPEVPEATKRRAIKAARRYFDLACRYAEELPPALLVITCGLAGSGKSTVAQTLHASWVESSSWVEAPASTVSEPQLLSSDIIRKELEGLPPDALRRVPYDQGMYASKSRDRVYEELLHRAGQVLREGKTVIVDASFVRREHRKAFARLAKETGAQFACLLVQADEREIRKRLERREKGAGQPSDATWHVYMGQKRRFQRPTEVPAERLSAVDTTRPISPQIKGALSALRALSPLSVPR